MHSSRAKLIIRLLLAAMAGLDDTAARRTCYDAAGYYCSLDGDICSASQPKLKLAYI